MGISINGLSSGLDTAQMIKDLMAVERLPYTNLETKKTGLQTEQGVFRTINTKFKSLEAALNSLKNGSDYSQLKATSSGTSASATTTSGATAGSYNINVTSLATANVVTVNANYILGQIDTTEDVKIGDYTLSSDDKQSIKDAGGTSEDKLKKLAEIINKQSSSEANASNATASVMKTSSNGDFKLVLTSNLLGTEKEVSFTKGTSSVSLIEASANVTNTKGTNAEFTLNGVAISRDTNEFSDLISGVTFKLSGTGSSTVSVAADTTTLVNNMKIFVTAYNDLISLVKDNLSKPADKDTTNPLQGNSLLKQINNELYSLFNGGVITGTSSDGNGGTKDVVSFMQDIGLSIDKGAKSASEMTGKITFNETAFTDAFAADPEKVIKLLTNEKPEGAGNTSNAPVSNVGIFTKFSDIMGNYTSTVNGMLNSKITGYDSEIKVVDERMESMDMRLQAKEARYKLQFSNMEVMLSSLKSEQSWLKSQFDALLPSTK